MVEVVLFTAGISIQHTLDISDTRTRKSHSAKITISIAFPVDTALRNFINAPPPQRMRVGTETITDLFKRFTAVEISITNVYSISY